MSKTKTSSANIRDVARLAGVSVATVSRYLNKTTPVAAETAARLDAVMAELNYIPMASARNLATQKTQTIGLLLSDMHGDFFAPLISGIEEVTSSNGLDLLISSTHRTRPRRSFPPPVGPQNSDGVLVFAGSLDQDGLARFAAMQYPFVLIHQTPPENIPAPCVTVENKAASRNLVDHLIEVHARRKIVFLRGPESQEDSHWRELGYRESLANHAMAIDPTLIGQGEFDRHVARRTIKGLLAAGVEFDAVFSGDDDASVGVLAALLEAGIRVPKDVAVVGFDDQRLSAYLTPPLTTVRSPTEQVGRAAAEQLVRVIANQPVEPLILLPTEIVVRSSCGCGPEFTNDMRMASQI